MGTFCGLLKAEGSSISVEKREEFFARIRELFYRGGMFDWDYYILFGEEYLVLKRAMPHEQRISFNYNYFEDDFHEEAGFNMDNNRVWSGKVDTGDYARESYTSDRFVFIKNRSSG